MANKILKNETPELGQPLTAELLGRAIRARRTQSGLRLEDTAALCGVAKQTLQNIEKGSGKSKLETISSSPHNNLETTSGFPKASS